MTTITSHQTIITPISRSGNLHDAFELQCQIYRVQEMIADLECEKKSFQKIVTAICEDYARAQIVRDGLYYLECKTITRRNVKPDLVQELYPEVWDQIKTCKESCNLPDLQKHLSGKEIDQVVSKTQTTTYEIMGDWKQIARKDKEEGE